MLFVCVELHVLAFYKERRNCVLDVLLVSVAPSMKTAILPEFALQVMWTPAPDASRSSLTYVINVTVESDGTEKPLSASVPHPISMENFTRLSPCSAGSVLLQAANPGAMSKTVSVSFRMVNLTGEGMLYGLKPMNLDCKWIYVLYFKQYFICRHVYMVFKLLYCSE